jgi:hypothetical protein
MSGTIAEGDPVIEGTGRIKKEFPKELFTGKKSAMAISSPAR